MFGWIPRMWCSLCKFSFLWSFKYSRCAADRCLLSRVLVRQQPTGMTPGIIAQKVEASFMAQKEDKVNWFDLDIWTIFNQKVYASASVRQPYMSPDPGYSLCKGFSRWVLDIVPNAHQLLRVYREKKRWPSLSHNDQYLWDFDGFHI